MLQCNKGKCWALCSSDDIYIPFPILIIDLLCCCAWSWGCRCSRLFWI
jgi:hypothetical protein